MSVAELQHGFRDLATRLYAAEETTARRGRFRERLRQSRRASVDTDTDPVKVGTS